MLNLSSLKGKEKKRKLSFFYEKVLMAFVVEIFNRDVTNM